MCGIAGVAGEVRDKDRLIVREMCRVMRHRGPDDEGYLDQDGICLGMRRLSIIDVAHGFQPVASEDSSVSAVFNGEIYNYRSLQKFLEANGHRLSSDSDSECLPHLYEEFGTAMFRHLRGMFAVAAWSSKDRTLTLGRDRIGKKPLFYWADGERLWFASELKCLLQIPSLRRSIDFVALDSYLTYQYVPAPQSIIAGVCKLPPAHWMTWRDGNLHIERYWEPTFQAGATEGSTGDIVDAAGELRDRILDATAIRMVSERPLGAFLSGGLDSSAVVAAMSRAGSGPVSTFSIGFADESHNELPYARKVAQLYSTQHHELIVTPDVADLLPRIARMFDEPFADSSAVPSYYVAEMTREHVIVALNGDGGDESFGGYRRYVNFLKPGVELSLPNTFARLSGKASAAAYRRSHGYPRVKALASKALRAAGKDAPERYGRQVSYFTPEERSALYQPALREALAGTDSYQPIRDVWLRHARADLVNRLLAVDQATYLPGDLLTKVDMTTMAVSLEARSPLLDHTLIAWAATLPGSWKVRNGQTKYLMKLAMEPWLPKELIYRKKQGFAIPMQSWLSGALWPMVMDVVAAPESHLFSFFDPREVQRILKVHRSSGDGSEKVWALLMLELSLRNLLGD